MNTIQWRPVPGTFKDTLFNTLEQLEAPTYALLTGLHSRVKTPTIGIGYDLKMADVRVRKTVFEVLGLDVDNAWIGVPTVPGSSAEKEQRYIKRLLVLIDQSNTNQGDYDAVMHARATDSDNAYKAAYPNRRSVFKFSDRDEVWTVFDSVWESVYKDKIFAKLPTLINDTEFQNSKELIALASIVWLGTFGPKTAQAIKDGNRAKAWYEMRYGWSESDDPNPRTNPNNGWAKRHYFDSAMFGLYNDPANSKATEEEARQTYEMLTKNRQRIMQREWRYGSRPDGRNPWGQRRIDWEPLGSETH